MTVGFLAGGAKALAQAIAALEDSGSLDVSFSFGVGRVTVAIVVVFYCFVGGSFRSTRTHAYCLIMSRVFMS